MFKHIIYNTQVLHILKSVHFLICMHMCMYIDMLSMNVCIHICIDGYIGKHTTHKDSFASIGLFFLYTRSLCTYNTFTDTKALFIPLSLPAFSFARASSFPFLVAPLAVPACARSPFLPFPQDVKNEKLDVVKHYRQLERARDALERRIAGLALPPPSSPSASCIPISLCAPFPMPDFELSLCSNFKDFEVFWRREAERNDFEFSLCYSVSAL